MPAKRPARPREGGAGPAVGRGEYQLLLEVERYESLAEEMEELGVGTLDEVRQKIQELHRRIDDQER